MGETKKQSHQLRIIYRDHISLAEEKTNKQSSRPPSRPRLPCFLHYCGDTPPQPSRLSHLLRQSHSPLDAIHPIAKEKPTQLPTGSPHRQRQPLLCPTSLALPDRATAPPTDGGKRGGSLPPPHTTINAIPMFGARIVDMLLVPCIPTLPGRKK